jgi:hypothetical protein
MLTVLADTFMIATRLEPWSPRAEGKRWYRQAVAAEPVRRRGSTAGRGSAASQEPDSEARPAGWPVVAARPCEG